MIGIWRGYSGEYLYVVAAGTLILFGLPLLFLPIRWAKILRWQIPDHEHLAIYFGRCLGAVICVIACFAFVAGSDPLLQLFFFRLILANFAVMIAVHAYGAVRKIQPMSETLEIGYWVLLFLISLLFYPD